MLRNIGSPKRGAVVRTICQRDTDNVEAQVL